MSEPATLAERTSSVGADENDRTIDELTGFQRDLLAIVAAEGPCKGQVILDGIQDAIESDVTHGRLYPNLDTLSYKGLIDKQSMVPDDRSNTYQITTEGVAVLETQLQWLTWMVEAGDL